MIPKLMLTSQGAALLAKVPAGAALSVTRWQMGSGALRSGESLDRTALVRPVDDLPVSEITTEGSRATVWGQFTNQRRPAFVFEELGLWAADGDGGELLLCYGNAFGAGEHIQAGTEHVREFVFGTVLLFSKTANVTAVVDQSLVFLTRKEKGAPGGVAELDESGKVPEEQLPTMPFLPLAGGTMEGAIEMDGQGIHGLPKPTEDQAPLRKVDGLSAATAASLGLSASSVPDDAFLKLKASIDANQKAQASALDNTRWKLLKTDTFSLADHAEQQISIPNPINSYAELMVVIKDLRYGSSSGNGGIVVQSLGNLSFMSGTKHTLYAVLPGSSQIGFAIGTSDNEFSPGTAVIEPSTDRVLRIAGSGGTALKTGTISIYGKGR